MQRVIQELPDWSNINVLHRGTLPPRASFFPFKSAKNALSYNAEQSEALCLSGIWKFDHSSSPYKAPAGFQDSTYDSTEWNDIPVPGMWQMHGFGKPHYTNEPYPFPVDPPYGKDH